MSDWKAKVEEILKAGAKKHFASDPKMVAEIPTSPIAQLVVALPFISECPAPDALAAKNFDTLLQEVKKPGTYAHRAGMSLRRRLAPGDNFTGAKNPRAADKGMMLLELASLQDHLHDREADRASNTPNPLNEGLDYQTERNRLVKAIGAIPSADIDGIITAEQLIARSERAEYNGYWFY